MMKKKIVYTPVFILAVVILYSLSLQCYTTFNHPKVFVDADSTGYFHGEDVSLIDDCSSCHQQEEPYAMRESDIYDDQIYQDHYNWNYYYVTPWWFDEDYYYNSQPIRNTDSLEPTRRRDFGRRDPLNDIRPGTGSPNSSRPSLSKPQTDDTSPSTNPTARSERRSSVSDKNKTKKSSAPKPKRVSREKKVEKKKKK